MRSSETCLVSPSLQRRPTWPQNWSIWVTTGAAGVATDGAGKDIGPAGARGIGAVEDPLIDQLLGHGLVAGDLHQLVVTHDVTAAVSHLQQICARPYTDPQGEGGGHAALSIGVVGVLDDRGVDLHGGVGQGIGERGVLVSIGGVVGLDALGDVIGDALDGEAAGLFARLGAAHTIGDHGHEGESLGGGQCVSSGRLVRWISTCRRSEAMRK